MKMLCIQVLTCCLVPSVSLQEPDKFNGDMEDIKTLEGVPSVEFVAEFCKQDAKIK